MMVVARGPLLSAPSLKAGHPALKTVVIRMILLVNTVLGSLGPRRPRGPGSPLLFSLALSFSYLSPSLYLFSFYLS